MPGSSTSLGPWSRVNPPDTAHERIQWTQSVEKTLQEVQPHDDDEGHATLNGSHQPRQAKGLGDVATHIDR